jgi:hypothetical protein
MFGFSGVQIFSFRHLATEVGLTAKDVASGDGCASLKFEFKLRPPALVIAEDELKFSIAARFNAKEGKSAAGVEVDCKLEALRGEFSAHAALASSRGDRKIASVLVG